MNTSQDRDPSSKNNRRRTLALLALGAIFLFWGWQKGLSRLTLTTAQAESQQAESPPVAHVRMDLDHRAIREVQCVSLPDSAFQIVMPAGALVRPARVALSECAAADKPAPPPDQICVSPVYRYALSPVSTNRTSAFITLQFACPDSVAAACGVYLYEPDFHAWSRLGTPPGYRKGRVTARTRHAEGIVAVFAERLAGGEALKRKIRVPAFLVVDAQTGEVLLARNSTTPRAIASLTKLMTASVFLDNLPAWDRAVTFQPEDRVLGSRLHLRPGDQLSVDDLFHAALMKSANDATMALVRASGLSVEAFVAQMNQKARALGMTHTTFVEPTGLSPENRSTPEDYVKLARHLLQNPIFREVTSMPHYTVTAVRGTRRRAFTFRNTNRMLQQASPIILSKTGFTLEAGRCLLVGARNDAGKEIVAVVMGARVAGSQYRDMRLLLNAALEDPGGVSAGTPFEQSDVRDLSLR